MLLFDPFRVGRVRERWVWAFVYPRSFDLGLFILDHVVVLSRRRRASARAPVRCRRASARALLFGIGGLPPACSYSTSAGFRPRAPIQRRRAHASIQRKRKKKPAG